MLFCLAIGAFVIILFLEMGGIILPALQTFLKNFQGRAIAPAFQLLPTLAEANRCRAKRILEEFIVHYLVDYDAMYLIDPLLRKREALGVIELAETALGVYPVIAVCGMHAHPCVLRPAVCQLDHPVGLVRRSMEQMDVHRLALCLEVLDDRDGHFVSQCERAGVVHPSLHHTDPLRLQ